MQFAMCIVEVIKANDPSDSGQIYFYTLLFFGIWSSTTNLLVHYYKQHNITYISNDDFCKCEKISLLRLNNSQLLQNDHAMDCIIPIALHI